MEAHDTQTLPYTDEDYVLGAMAERQETLEAEIAERHEELERLRGARDLYRGDIDKETLELAAEDEPNGEPSGSEVGLATEKEVPLSKGRTSTRKKNGSGNRSRIPATESAQKVHDALAEAGEGNSLTYVELAEKTGLSTSQVKVGVEQAVADNSVIKIERTEEEIGRRAPVRVVHHPGHNDH